MLPWRISVVQLYNRSIGILVDVLSLETKWKSISYLCPLFSLSSSFVTFQARQWLLPRAANFSHMYPTFINSYGPICLSKCVCCVLFPAWFVPLPALRWAPLSPGVWDEASRYLYRPNSWGPPSQSREGWGGKGDVWRNYHGNFRLNQALEMSLCSPFFFSSLVFLAVLSLSRLCNPSGRVRSYSAQVSRIGGSPSHVPSISLFASSPLFIGHATCFLKHSRCLYF